jgi:hypothetical protein
MVLCSYFSVDILEVLGSFEAAEHAEGVVDLRIVKPSPEAARERNAQFKWMHVT